MKVTRPWLDAPDAGLLVIEPARHGDARGWFQQTYGRAELAAAGFDREFVQDNHSMSARRGVVRGLHFQAPPHAQDKLVRVARGAILDAVVDIRRGAPSFGRAFAVELSEENGRQLLVPAGFAHGFMTLSDRADVLYKVSAPYAPASEGGLLWCDPALGLAWPLAEAEALVNARDARWPTLAEMDTPFTWRGGA